MLSPISLEKAITKSIKITNYLKDGSTSSNTFYIGDVVEDFSFVSNSEKLTKTGKLTKVNHEFKKSFTGLTSSYKSPLSTDAYVSVVSIDTSKQYAAESYNVNVRDILDYNAESEVVRVKVDPVVKISLKVTLSDDSTSEVELVEGAAVNATLLQPSRKEVEGEFTVAAFTYAVNQKFEPTYTGVVLTEEKTVESDDESEETTTTTSVIYVPFKGIKKISVVTETGDDESEPLDEDQGP